MKISDELRAAMAETYVPEALSAELAILEACDEPQEALLAALENISERLIVVASELEDWRSGERDRG